MKHARCIFVRHHQRIKTSTNIVQPDHYDSYKQRNLDEFSLTSWCENLK